MKRPDETLRKLRIHAQKYGATEDVKLLWAWIEALEAEIEAARAADNQNLREWSEALENLIRAAKDEHDKNPD